jgi:hypothetical protein
VISACGGGLNCDFRVIYLIFVICGGALFVAMQGRCAQRPCDDECVRH